MEATEQLSGSHATASPSGQLLVCIANGKLRIHYAQAPERATDIHIKVLLKDVFGIRWSSDGSRMLVHSGQSIEVLDIEDDTHRTRLDNGSCGLGRFHSADFIGNDLLLVVWEFGKAKVWDLASGKATDLGDLKTCCDGSNWALRPGKPDPDSLTLALLARVSAQDHLAIHFATTGHTIPAKLSNTTDAKGLTWSPDGHWLAVLDEPYARPCLAIFTPDGNPFRTYPPSAQADADGFGLGVKAITWSPDSRILALSRYDHTVVLLNTRTFSPLAIIEHSTTIDQHGTRDGEQVLIWQENVSASNVRSYATASQPVSPPLSRSKASTDPAELGTAEARLSSDGRYLATRDERMLNTVWVWDMGTLCAHAVLLQHNNVRRMHWHPSRPELLMLDCGESIAYLFDASGTGPPAPLQVTLPATPTFSFLPASSVEAKPVILAATKSTFCLVYPEGRSDDAHDGNSNPANFEEGESEDSLIEVLTGRKPVPSREEPSYTEMIDIAAETEDDTAGLDDTFREKKRPTREATPDPLDDSQIF